MQIHVHLQVLTKAACQVVANTTQNAFCLIGKRLILLRFCFGTRLAVYVWFTRHHSRLPHTKGCTMTTTYDSDAAAISACDEQVAIAKRLLDDALIDLRIVDRDHHAHQVRLVVISARAVGYNEARADAARADACDHDALGLYDVK